MIRLSEVLFTTPSALLLPKDLSEAAASPLADSDLYRLKFLLSTGLNAQIDSVFDEWVKQKGENARTSV